MPACVQHRQLHPPVSAGLPPLFHLAARQQFVLPDGSLLYASAFASDSRCESDLNRHSRIKQNLALTVS